MHAKATFAIGLAVAAAVVAPALAQERPGPLTLIVHPLKGGAYWIEGGRANTGFIVGDKGVVVFDAQMTADGVRQELSDIAKVTSKPVDAIIISHADPDHVGGVPYYPAGIPIIAHENTRSEIVVSAADPNGGPMMGSVYKALLKFLPTHTIGATEPAVIDGVRMTLMYVAPAHTSGDIFVYLPVQKIVFAGDIITTNTGRFPVIHLGGSSLGWIAAMKALLALDADIYVPGHGAIETKPMLRVRLADAEQRREQIKAMVNANKTLPEVEQALPDAGDGPMFRTFTQTTYDELTRGYPPASPPWNNLVKR